MFFKKFRRFIRARARKQYAERTRQRQWESEQAQADIEYQQRMERERSDGAYITLESAFIWSVVYATPEQVIAVRDNLLAQGWKPPSADEGFVHDPITLPGAETK